MEKYFSGFLNVFVIWIFDKWSDCVDSVLDDGVNVVVFVLLVDLLFVLLVFNFVFCNVLVNCNYFVL